MTGVETGLFGTPTSAALTLAVVFVASGVLARYFVDYIGHSLATTGWGLLAVFWVLQIHKYLAVDNSVLGAGMAISAAIFSVLLVRYSLATYDHPWRLSHALSVAGLIYVTFTLAAGPRQWLIEMVTQQTVWGLNQLGYTPTIIAGPEYGYQSAIRFSHETAGPLTTHIEIACTGVGSIAVICGILAAIEGEVERRLGLAAVISTAIYLMNFVRNVFIAAAFGDQWFQIGVDHVLALTSFENEPLVSFFIADKVIAQLLSAVVLFVILFTLIRVMPGMRSILEDVFDVLPAALEHRLRDILGLYPTDRL